MLDWLKNLFGGKKEEKSTPTVSPEPASAPASENTAVEEDDVTSEDSLSEDTGEEKI